MAAGTAYAKRYGTGFTDLDGSKPVDAAFLNAVETALLQLIGSAPTADGQVAQWDNANTRFGPALILNKNIDAAAAIAKSKLDFTGANGIVNADIAGAAAIVPSKLSNPGDVTKRLAGDGTWQPGALVLIDDYTVTGSVLASYDTNTRLGGNIPQTYKDLVLCVTGRGDAATPVSTLQMRMNADSAANYDYQIATVQGAALGTTANANGQTTTVIGRLTAATADAGRPASGEWVFPNYTGTTFYKECRGVIGDSYSGASALETGTSYAVWRSNNAITRLQIFPGSGNFVVGTRFTLYGRA